MGVATGGVWSGNLRALRHVITMRADEAAEEEIYYVFSNILAMITEKEPYFFRDFTLITEENYQKGGPGIGSWVPKYRKV